MSRKLVLASGNQGKLKEIRALIDHYNYDFEVLNLASFSGVPEIIEDGETFYDNAFKKAYTVANYTNCLSLADDSGLEVDYLHGAPGIHSARFAGEKAGDEDNIKKLLSLLHEVPREKRTARFKCVICIVTREGEKFFAEGKCEGMITCLPKGNNGFGYDPVFYLPHYKKTMAEITPEEKNKISHRALALQEALKILEKI